MMQNNIYNMPLKLCNTENRNAIKVERRGSSALCRVCCLIFKQCNMMENNKCFCRGDWLLLWCIDMGGVDLKDAFFQNQFFKFIWGKQWHFHFLCKKTMYYLPHMFSEDCKQTWAFGSYFLVYTKLFHVIQK